RDQRREDTGVGVRLDGVVDGGVGEGGVDTAVIGLDHRGIYQEGGGGDALRRIQKSGKAAALGPRDIMGSGEERRHFIGSFFIGTCTGKAAMARANEQKGE